MTVILDRFNRPALGPNWESPARAVAADDGPLIMIAGKDGVEMNPIDVGDEFCSGIYIGEGELNTTQWSEVELLEEINFQDYPTYLEDYATMQVSCNGSLAASGSAEVYFRIQPNQYYTYYEELLWTIIVRDVTGANISGVFHNGDPLQFFDDLAVPVGTKLRLENVEGVYTAYMYSPHTGIWHNMATLEDHSLSGGYPGISLYSITDASDSQVTNFRASGVDGWNSSFFGNNPAMSKPFMPPRANDPRVQQLIGTTFPSAIVDIGKDVRDALAIELGIEPYTIQIDDAWHQYAAANGLDPYNPDPNWDYTPGGGATYLPDPLPPMSSLSLGNTDDSGVAQCEGLWWNADGTKLYTVHRNAAVKERTFSTPFDVTTLTGTIDHAIIAGSAWDIAFSQDGTGMFIADNASNEVRWWLLDAPYNVADAVGRANDSNFTADTPVSVSLSQEGDYIYWSNNTGLIKRKTMPTPWDMFSIGGAPDDYSHSFPTYTGRFDSMIFSADGTQVWIIPLGDIARSYTLSTAWDTQTATLEAESFEFTGPGVWVMGMMSPQGRDELWVCWSHVSGTLSSYTWP